MNSTFSYVTETYYLLTKPRIIFGNAITMVAGFSLGSFGHFNFLLFLNTLIGLSLIIGSACVFNNYIDREADRKMSRTQNRPLAFGSISTQHAIFFALFIGAIGLFFLAMFTNWIATGLAFCGFLVYVIFYSLSKYYTHHSTLIGTLAGAMPPVVGYCSASQTLDVGAFLFFTVLVFWQMPHFFAIAIYRFRDYQAASIPVYPLVKGIFKTKIQMTVYAFGFLLSLILLGISQNLGAFTLFTSILSALWVGQIIGGFWAKDDVLWAKRVFFFSLFVILAISFSILFWSSAPNLAKGL